MFGASEDRARQLAGRQRWKRIGSVGSNSSRRSASSSSQASQLSQCETWSMYEQELLWPIMGPDFSAFTFDDYPESDSVTSHSYEQSPTICPAEEVLSQMTATNTHPRVQQQRRQSEHLSQVLYNDSAVEIGPPPPSFSSVLPSQLKQYGVLGWGAKILHQVRHASAPDSQTPVQEDPSSPSAAFGPTTRSASVHSEGVQTTASLRGGAGDDARRKAWSTIMRGPHVALFFNTGLSYRAFVDSLSEEKCLLFTELFGESTDLSQANNLKRQLFYRGLDDSGRDCFGKMVIHRGVHLVDAGIHRMTFLDALPLNEQKFQNGDRYPMVNLARLMIAGNAIRDPDGYKSRFYSGGGGGGSNNSAATRANLNKLFDQYRENATEEPDLVGVDGTMDYLQQLEVDLEGLDSLAVLEIIQAPTMGEITRTNFVNGWLERDCDTIDKQKAYLGDVKTQLPIDKTVFTRVYKYTFFLAKSGQQKAVPLEAAVAYWDLLFASPLSAVKWSTPSTPWLDWWKEFLEASWKKSVNKDMWNETLKFAQLTLQDEAITFWNEESSWPSVIDDFVEWVRKEKRGGGDEQKAEEMEY